MTVEDGATCTTCHNRARKRRDLALGPTTFAYLLACLLVYLLAARSMWLRVGCRLMDRKAWENLEAARVLLGQKDPCTNAAASRAYYAAYHACWSAMNERHIRTPEVRPGVHYFQHDKLPWEALQRRVLDRGASRDLEELRELRVTADYFEDDLTVSEVTRALERANAFVRSLLKEPDHGE